jgi:hypothetical protein
VRKVLKETQDVLAQRKQHVYHYLYVDNRTFFSSGRNLLVVQVCHLCEKAIASFAWNVQSPGIFVTASNYRWLYLLGVSSKDYGDRHFTAQYGPCSCLTTRGLYWRKFKASELPKSQKIRHQAMTLHVNDQSVRKPEKQKWVPCRASQDQVLASWVALLRTLVGPNRGFGG